MQNLEIEGRRFVTIWVISLGQLPAHTQVLQSSCNKTHLYLDTTAEVHLLISSMANIVGPDQTAPKRAVWSGATMFIPLSQYLGQSRVLQGKLLHMKCLILHWFSFCTSPRIMTNFDHSGTNFAPFVFSTKNHDRHSYKWMQLVNSQLCCGNGFYSIFISVWGTLHVRQQFAQLHF